MLWRMAKTVLIVGLVGIGLAIIGRALIDDNEFSIQTKKIPQDLEVSAMNHLMAEDLAMTTSMFLKQLSAQMQRWADQNLSDQELRSRFQEEITEHPHFHGFAILEEGKVIEEVGEVERLDPDKLTHRHMKSNFSDPYSVDGQQYMLMGEDLEDGRTVLGEIDLSFVRSFVKGLASVADANGTFFVSGADPEVEWETTADIPEKLESETVPELGWQIVVHSDEQQPEHLQRPFYEHQAVIKFKHSEFAPTWLAENRDFHVLEDHNPLFVVESKTESTQELIERLRRDYDLSLVEPNYKISKQVILFSTDPNETRNRTSSPTVRRSPNPSPRQTAPREQVQQNVLQTKPNDEFFEPYQWNLDQIEIDEGWNLSGGRGVKIAILDTGVDPNHLDIAEKLGPGYNSFDDSSDFSDAHGHGTHVAGVAAALTNNVTGIAGISWDSTILPVKVLNDEGEGSSFEVAQGIYWAVEQGADVINMSLGDYYPSELLHDAIRYAYEQDVILIAASGNDNVQDPMYPAHYEEVFTVAAVNDARNRAFFSNYGEHIDVAAPGEHIPSLFPDNNYVVMSGTSMAAPHVAGLAGLIRSLRPDLSNEEVYNVMRSTAKDLGVDGHDPYYGFGEIDIAAALQSIAN
ncbi:S8 family peptidase [Alkalihalobacillus sp. MEB130]|uniref:S8 family peptidase n=1 Tax=Alkalihalobacillus sp. MEB130 TaxID=2976704 RepID=UPI0028DF297D|nr:S8 family peptidase [Alkalihalobacillus sp. MEB130]MDT8859883.1 S8 family peptidase [Alkalihalobacillus sp. MEB130]